MSKARRIAAWVFSRQGAHDIAAIAVALSAAYKGLHEAGMI